MTSEPTKVPAIQKCFAILDLLAQSKEPMGISDVSRRLHLNKSSVFNIIRTLMDLNVLESLSDGKFGFGTRFYVLGNIAGMRSPLIQTTHPYLETINEKTKLSAFLGLRADLQTILIDKVDSAHGIKVSSEIGMRMPSLAGPGIKAMLSLLPDAEIDSILRRCELKKYTPFSITDKETYREEILSVRKQGIAYDRQEYIEGMVAFAVPIRLKGRDVQAAVWAVGLTHQVPDPSIPDLTDLLKGISQEISHRLR